MRFEPTAVDGAYLADSGITPLDLSRTPFFGDDDRMERHLRRRAAHASRWPTSNPLIEAVRAYLADRSGSDGGFAGQPFLSDQS